MYVRASLCTKLLMQQCMCKKCLRVSNFACSIVSVCSGVCASKRLCVKRSVLDRAELVGSHIYRSKIGLNHMLLFVILTVCVHWLTASMSVTF